MMFTRKKFLYKIKRKIKGEDNYGRCPKCNKLHSLGDIVFGRRSKRYCFNCYLILFGKRGLKKHLENYEFTK